MIERFATPPRRPRAMQVIWPQAEHNLLIENLHVVIVVIADVFVVVIVANISSTLLKLFMNTATPSTVEIARPLTVQTADSWPS